MKTRRNVLLTGASTGIGYELARIFGREGWSMALVARNEERLRQVAELFKGRAHVIADDLSDPTAPARIQERLAQLDFPVDALVNNAGFGSYGPFMQNPLDVEMREIQVNIAALTALTKIFGPSMVKQGSGRIMNVASVAAFPPGPLMAVYYATKAYVLSFSEALSYELRGTGVTVTCLCPGPTKTEFGRTAGVDNSIAFQGKIADAASVAEYGYAAMMSGKSVAIPGLGNRVAAFAARHSPWTLSAGIVYRLQKKRGSSSH